MTDSSNSSNKVGRGNTITLPNEEGSRPRKQAAPSKRFSFTLYNFDEDWKKQISSWFHENDKFVVGLEICPKTLRKHLQGYAEFDKKCRPLVSMQKTWKGAHCEKSKGNRNSNIKYCSKDGDFLMQGFDLHTFECSAQGIIDWFKSCERDTLLYYRGDVPSLVVFRTQIFQAVFRGNEIKLPSNMTALRNAIDVAFHACLSGLWDGQDAEYREQLAQMFISVD